MNRETVIKITAVVAIAALMFSLILVFNGMIGYAADDYLYFFKYTGHVVKGTPERLTGIRDIFTGMGRITRSAMAEYRRIFSCSCLLCSINRSSML